MNMIMPIKVKIESGHSDWHLKGADRRTGSHQCGIALRHGQNEIGFSNDTKGREVVAAAQADMATQPVLAELYVLGTRTAATRSHHDVLLFEIGRQGETWPHTRM